MAGFFRFRKSGFTELLFEYLSQQAAEHLACSVAIAGIAATAKDGAQQIDDIAAGILLAQHGEQVRGDRSQDVGNLIVRGVGLAAQSGNNGSQIAAEDLLQNLQTILDINAETLSSVVAQSLSQRSGPR